MNNDQSTGMSWLAEIKKAIPTPAAESEEENETH